MRVFEVELDDKTIETVRQFDNIHPINKNDQIRIFGKVVLHKRWGRQFQARDVLKRIPTSAAGVAKILAGKEFKGIGPKLAEKIATKLGARSEEHTSELQSLMRISYAVFCLKKKNKNKTTIEITLIKHTI